MSGRGRDEEEDPANEKEETDQEVQETQQPSRILPGFCPVSAEVGPGRVHHRDPEPPPKTREPQTPATSRTAEPAYPELGGEPLTRGPGRQKEGRVEEQEAEPLEEYTSPPFTRGEDPSPVREPLEEQYNTDKPGEEEQEPRGRAEVHQAPGSGGLPKLRRRRVQGERTTQAGQERATREGGERRAGAGNRKGARPGAGPGPEIIQAPQEVGSKQG